MVDAKGPTPATIQRRSTLIRELGLTQYTYRSDREIVLRKLSRAAAIAAGLPEANVEDLSVDVVHQQDAEVHGAAVPEESVPGESQSNGAAERAVQMVEDQIRTIKLSTEHRLKGTIPMEHPLMHWMVEHAVMTLTNFNPGSDDGRTGYGRLHGHKYNARMREFGQAVMWYVPKFARHKLDPRWRVGCFLGRPWNSDQNFLMVNDGSVIRPRAMVRIIEEKRWDPYRLETLHMLPCQTTTATPDAIEQDPAPHVGLQPDKTKDEHTDESLDADAHDPQPPRRMQIKRPDLEKHGYTDGCPKCTLHRSGLHQAAGGAHRSELCRQRLYRRMCESGDARAQDAAKKGRLAPRPGTSGTPPPASSPTSPTTTTPTPTTNPRHTPLQRTT